MYTPETLAMRVSHEARKLDTDVAMVGSRPFFPPTSPLLLSCLVCEFWFIYFTSFFPHFFFFFVLLN